MDSDKEVFGGEKKVCFVVIRWVMISEKEVYE